uniref:L-lysine permease n=1 Tax=uncultured bacterium A1Q1_fos_2116 TaxID=1256564 RepID=L7W025_9BACT|nr:L-lysine permease [uncultured bacterium A1Q1_fos_2116]
MWCHTGNVYGVIDLPTFLAGLVVIILLPGPNSMYVLSLAARKGAATAYQGVAGVFLGDTVLMTLSAAGVASLLRANPVAFMVVRWAGALYLAYLAFGILRRAFTLWRKRHEGNEALTAVMAETGIERPFRRAFTVSLLNPKAILFFVAFFVQFVDPNYPYPALSFLVLGAIAQIGSILYLSVLIFTGTRLAEMFRQRKVLTVGANTTVGVAFLIFAAKMTLTG